MQGGEARVRGVASLEGAQVNQRPNPDYFVKPRVTNVPAVDLARYDSK